MVLPLQPLKEKIGVYYNNALQISKAAEVAKLVDALL